jgi:hypothetical protein
MLCGERLEERESAVTPRSARESRVQRTGVIKVNLASLDFHLACH